jgi:MFS family permease
VTSAEAGSTAKGNDPESWPDGYPLRWRALAVLCSALSIVVIDNTILAVAIPAIEKGLHTDESGLQWIGSAYGLVLAGLLLLTVGLGDIVTGRTKLLQYQDSLAQTPPAPVDPTALFPTSSEGAERRGIVVAKLAFYQVLLTAGQLLAAAGFTLIAAGVVRARFRGARAPVNLPPSR